MAKSLLKTRGAKKTRVTRSESYLINQKYLGPEPSFTAPLTMMEYVTTLNWYTYMCDTNDARGYINDYLVANNRLAEAKLLKRVSDARILNTVAWLSRMLNRGYTLPGDPKLYIDVQLASMLLKAKADDSDKLDAAPKTSIQDRVKERANDIIADLEQILDEGLEFKMYDWLQKGEIPATYAPMIVQKYKPVMDELVAALDGQDEQLKEAYAYLSKKELKDKIKFFADLISDTEKYAGVAKKTRAPNKPRTISTEKLLKNFKCQKESTEFKIASINPEKIIGAQELWCFNTKYNTVTVFRALDRGGLKVKGTAIIGFDEKTSSTKGTGRKPEIVVDKIMKSGKIILRKLMDEMKTNKVLQYRINENTILLKVVS